MKKLNISAKKLFVVFMAVVLLVCCFSTNTFSWFDRASEQYTNGKELSLSVPNSAYYTQGENGGLQEGSPKAFSGNGVSISTYLSEDDGISFSETAADPATEGSLDPGERIYYKTVIDNTGTGATDQNVSLYIKNFAPGGESGANLCVGTNVPVKCFKNYSMYDVTIPSPTKNKVNGTTKRVYFEPWGKIPTGTAYDGYRTNWKTNPTEYYVVSGGANTDIDANNGSNATYTKMENTGYDGPNYTSTKIYYADIPWDHNKLYFAVNDWNGTNYLRTQTFTDLNSDGLSMTQSLLFYISGQVNDYNNSIAGKQYCTGANFASYFNKATLYYNANSAQSISLALTSSDYQSNSNVTYTMTGTGFTLDTTTSPGLLTPTGSGSGTVTFTATSYYGDTKTVSANVTVNEISANTATIKAAPIVTNLMIPAGEKQDVYWFIQNGDSMYGAATVTGTYRLDGIYIGA